MGQKVLLKATQAELDLTMVLRHVLWRKDQDDIRRIEDISALIIKKYMDLFYKRYAKQFETDHLRYKIFARQKPLFVFEKPSGEYSNMVQIDKRGKQLILEIRKIAKDFDKLLEDDDQKLPRVYFDEHLYVPILIHSKKIDRISLVEMVKSEKAFINDIREYLKKNI